MHYIAHELDIADMAQQLHTELCAYLSLWAELEANFPPEPPK